MTEVMTRRKRVAVIGAGFCGLGSIKSLKDEGIEPVCFERSGHYGGLWRYHDDDTEGVASVMKTTIINTSKEMGSLSDFPPPAEFPHYMHNSLMYEYLVRIAKKFNLLDPIKFHQMVVSVVKADDYQETGRWVVTTKDTRNDETTSETFDGVTVCVGHHVFPNIPTYPGMDDFQGKIMHTHSLKKVNGFEDLRVVVVGVGNSGVDAAVELSSVAKQVYLSSRRGAWVLPRVGPYGLPLDAFALRRCFHFIQTILPISWVSTYVEGQLNQRFKHATYNMKPEHRVSSTHPTVSDSLPIKLLSGVVLVRRIIKEFTKTGVIFQGEENVTEVDAVVFATGYEIKMPFLADDILHVEKNWVKLYKYIFPPHLSHPTLAILGLVQPIGPGIPVGEMQCRWASRVMNGKCSLPHKDKMLQEIEKHHDFVRKNFTESPRHTLQVDFFDYQDELAALIGCKPNFWKMALTDPKLFWACLTGPGLPYQYRLQGPHAWPEARNTILTYNQRIQIPLKIPGSVQNNGKTFHSAGRTFLLALAVPLLMMWLFVQIFITN